MVQSYNSLNCCFQNQIKMQFILNQINNLYDQQD